MRFHLCRVNDGLTQYEYLQETGHSGSTRTPGLFRHQQGLPPAGWVRGRRLLRRKKRKGQQQRKSLATLELNASNTERNAVRPAGKASYFCPTLKLGGGIWRGPSIPFRRTSHIDNHTCSLIIAAISLGAALFNIRIDS